MIQKILLSIILLFVSVNPVPVDEIGKSQSKLISVDEQISLLNKVGYETEDISIEFAGEQVPFFNYNEGTFSLISAGVDDEVGDYEFDIRAGGESLFSKNISIVEYDFPEVYQNIAYSPASLSPSELREINEKKETLFEALERRTEDRLWETSFDYPLEEMFITSDFGRKRIYTNYETQHKGTDIRASVGTSLYPMSEGEVLWTSKDELYFEGKSLVVDHGQGIVSIYMHLDEVLVDQGDFVEKDDVIARTGNSGLSTGPHLHLEIRIWDNRVDPITIVEEFRRIDS